MCGPPTTTNRRNTCTVTNMNIGDQLWTFISSIIAGEKEQMNKRERERVFLKYFV
jgi:hypothetical protein